eukprot:5730760-Pyramimonas_sp.AAC.1
MDSASSLFGAQSPSGAALQLGRAASCSCDRRPIPRASSYWQSQGLQPNERIGRRCERRYV